MNLIYLYRKILELFSLPKRKGIIYSTILGLFNSLIDVLTLSSVFPAVYVASQPEVIHKSKILSGIYQGLNVSDEEIFVLVILLTVLFLFLLRTVFSLYVYRYQQKIIFNASSELTEMMGNVFFLKTVLDTKKTTIGELDKEIRFLPMQFANYVLLPLGMIISEIIVISIILLGIISFKFKLFLMLVVTILPLVSILYWLIRKKVHLLGIDLNNASTLTFNHSRELISGYADIKMQDKVQYFVQRLIHSMRKYYGIQVKINVYQQIAPKLLEWSALLSVVLIYTYAVFFQESKSELLVILAIYLAAAYRLLPSLNRINSSLLLIKQYEYVLEIFEKAKKQIEIYHKELNTMTNQTINFNHQIELENIGLSYSNDNSKMILKDINLKINKGEMIGLVGKSGSGKTSLAYLISGLLPPTCGKIKIDNQVITKYNLPQWQKQIVFVYQDIFMLNGSILNNVAFGEDESKVDIKKVWDYLKAVQLEEFVTSLPQQIYTPIGESGGYLSGGQRQRLAIARALYKNASTIIMDEATSSLDEPTQEAIMKSIYGIAQKYHLTIILIAHRVTSLRYCHRIIYMEDGTIQKELSFNELIEKKYS